MKRRTKQFLIIAGAVILFGILLCLAGAAVGSAKGEQIFPAKTESGRSYTYYFGDSDIGRVKIDTVKAQINIIGNSEKSYIEIINFDENLSSFSNSNAMVTFRENEDVGSALKFWVNGFSFKGLRFLLRSSGSPEGGIVNIYLAQDVKIKAFDITNASGKVTVSDLSTPTDYNITVGSGSVSMKNISTQSVLSVASQDFASTKISLENVSAQSVTVNAPIADFDGSGIRAHTCDVGIRTGSATMDYAPVTDEKCTVDVKSFGKLTINNESFMDSFSYVPEGLDTGDEADYAYVNVQGEDLAVELSAPVEGINEKED